MLWSEQEEHILLKIQIILFSSMEVSFFLACMSCMIIAACAQEGYVI